MKTYFSLFFIFSIVVLNTHCTHHHYCTTSDNVQKSHYAIKEQPADSFVYKIIQPYKTKIDKDLNVKIAYTAAPLEKNTTCNNLAQLVFESMSYIADSLLQNNTNYYVLINYGGLRANIPLGDVFKKNIFELMPFDNSIVILELNDEQKNELLQKTKEKSKLLLKSKNNIPTYILVTSDYLYYGGDECNFLKPAKKINTANYLIRDAIIHYCSIKKQLNTSCFH